MRFLENTIYRGIVSFFVFFVFVLSLYPGITNGSPPGVLVVKLKDERFLSKLTAYDSQAELLFDRIYRIRVDDVEDALASLRGWGGIEYVESDQRLKSSLNASDPWFVLDTAELKRQWYLPKMQVHKAWEAATGSGITVAVIDTGIDGKHEDLSDGRVGSGFLSYCQVASVASPSDCLIRASGELQAGVNSDDNGHGTIVAGIIGAQANNNKGIAGINWSVRLMPVKVFDSTGSGFASDAAKGIRWAADNGAKVINLSIVGQGTDSSQVLQDAIIYAFNKGILVVAASGNDSVESGINLNTSPILPVCADSGQNMIVGVAATDIDDKKARFSNYGSNCVDISAPGTGTFIDRQQKQGLLSTYFDPSRPGEHNLYVYAVGTSVATPMVSGVAALMMSVFPDLDVKAIRDRLIGSVDNIDELNLTGCSGGSCVGQIGKGRINAYKAVSQVTSFSSGTVIRYPEGFNYLVERGLKRPVSEFVLKQRFAGVPVQIATLEQIESFPTGQPVPPVDSTIFKEPQDPTVYLIEDGERHALSYLAFVSRGLRFEDIATLPSPEVASYPKNADAPVLDGVLMKTADHPAVFILNNGMRQLLSFFVFKDRGFENKTIAIVPPEELAKFDSHPQGYLYPPVDGILLRGDSNLTVYLVENGKRRGLNLAAFQNRNLNFENVHVLPQSEVDGYEKGEDIIE